MDSFDAFRGNSRVFEHRLSHIIRNAHDSARITARKAEVPVALNNFSGLKELWVVNVLQIVNDTHRWYDGIVETRRGKWAEKKVRIQLAQQTPTRRERFCQFTINARE